MASYDELFTLAGDNVLLDKITIAITIAADTILNEANTVSFNAERRTWAKSAYDNPASQAKAFLYAMLAANNGATVAAITGASDSAIQTKVDAVVNIFAGV